MDSGFFVVGSVSMKHIQNKPERFAQSVERPILFVVHGVKNAYFAARNVRMIQCGIMFQVFAENVVKNSNCLEVIGTEAGVIFVVTGVILHTVAPQL
jgi:ABC-type proline/glycine betaine transport system ATPase subunit